MTDEEFERMLQRHRGLYDIDTPPSLSHIPKARFKDHRGNTITEERHKELYCHCDNRQEKNVFINGNQYKVCGNCKKSIQE